MLQIFREEIAYKLFNLREKYNLEEKKETIDFLDGKILSYEEMFLSITNTIKKLEEQKNEEG
jgi:hypothetical protein